MENLRSATPPTTFLFEDCLNTLSFDDNRDDITTMSNIRGKRIAAETIVNTKTEADVLALSRERYTPTSVSNFL